MRDDHRDTRTLLDRAPDDLDRMLSTHFSRCHEDLPASLRARLLAIPLEPRDTTGIRALFSRIGRLRLYSTLGSLATLLALVFVFVAPVHDEHVDVETLDRAALEEIVETALFLEEIDVAFALDLFDEDGSSDVSRSADGS